MRKGKRKLRLGRVLGVILSICMIAGNVSVSLTQSRADEPTVTESTDGTQSTEETKSEATESTTPNANSEATESATSNVNGENTESTTPEDTENKTDNKSNDSNLSTETPSETDTSNVDGASNAGSTSGDDSNTSNIGGTTPATEEMANPAKTGMGAGGTLNASISAEKVSEVFGAGNATFSNEDGANKITLLSSVQLESSVIIATDVAIELSGCSVTAPVGSAALIIGNDNVKVSLTNSDSGKTAKVIGGVGADADTGDAGCGGDGITITGSSATLSIGENVEVIGGDGGNITNTVAKENAGNGGNGGNGITDSNNNSTITVNGTVVGGDGGYGCTISGSTSNGGNGGCGVSSTNTSGVTGSGTVKGGNGGASGSAGTPGTAGTGASGNVTHVTKTEAGNGGYRLAITVNTDIGYLDFDDFEESAYQTKADMSGVLEGLTAEEKKAGNTVSLEFNVNVLTDNEFTEALTEDKEKADEKLGALKANETRIYYDFEITKNITSTNSNDNKTIKVTETPSPVVLTLVLPKSLQNGNYKIVRVHDGVTEELPVENDGKTVTFSSMKFSTFVLDYTPKTATTPQPAADDDKKQDGGSQQNGGNQQNNSDSQPSGTTPQNNSESQPSGTTPQSNSDTQPSGTTPQSNSESQGGASTGTVTVSGTGTNVAAGVQGSGANTAVNTSGSGTSNTVNTARNVAAGVNTAQVTGAKDSEPTTGDIRQSSAFIFVRLGTAAAVIYLISVLAETLSRRKK